MSTSSTRAFYLTERDRMGLGRSAVLLAVLSGCVRPAPPAVTAPSAAQAPGVGVALVEWQFPTTPSDLPVNPAQEALSRGEALRPALYPALSEANATESERGLERLEEHAVRTTRAYVAGRDRFSPPFLLNISTATPDALRAVIDHGVRVVSFSTGASDSLAGLDAVVREHPEVLFVAATPHISGNSISVEALGERPSVLATQGLPNVVLAGCLEFYDGDLETHRAGSLLGTPDNPFTVANQPIDTVAREVFLMRCGSAEAFAEGFGGTSAAAPILAALLAVVADHEAALGRPTTPADLLAVLDRVSHRTTAREESGTVHEVGYVTLDTLMLAAGRPPMTAAIWGDLADHPDPLPLP